MQIRHAGSSTGTVAACTTRPARSGGGTRASGGSRAGSSSVAWKREALLQPGRFTELFFLDEATAFAAGHRPCALCRHDDYRNFVTLWHELHAGDDGADAIDTRLHAERLEPGTRSGGCTRRRSRSSPTGRSSTTKAPRGSISPTGSDVGRPPATTRRCAVLVGRPSSSRLLHSGRCSPRAGREWCRFCIPLR